MILGTTPKALFIGTLVLLMAGCSGPIEGPQIEFIGVSKGTLETSIDQLSFKDRYEVTDRDLIGVVAFSHVDEGTEVTASWFTPDDRVPPFGRKTIVTESGAKIVRFSLSNTEDWSPAPYLMQIQAGKKFGNTIATASGSFHFAIGLTDEQIQNYIKEYSGWLRQEQERTRAVAIEQEWEGALINKAKELLNAPNALLALRHDVLGDAEPEYIIVDTEDQAAFQPSMNPAILLSHPVQQFMMVAMDGSVPLSLRLDGIQRVLESGGVRVGDAIPWRGGVTLTLLPSGTATLTWADGSMLCTSELEPNPGGYTEKTRLCK